MENWEEYKKVYKTIQIPDVNTEWENIRHRLPRQQKHRFTYYFRYATAFAAVVLIIGAGVVSASQKAQPGEALYSLKQFTSSFGQIKPKKPDTIIQKKVTPPLIKKPTPTITPTPTPKQSPAQSSAKIEKDVQGAHIENTNRENGNQGTDTAKGQQNTNSSQTNGSGNNTNTQSGNDNQGQGNGNTGQGKSDESHGNSDNAHSNSNGNSGDNSDKGNGSGKSK